MDANEPKEGWKILLGATRWHYFRAGQSLCRRWAELSHSGMDPKTFKSPDNCKVCYDKRIKEIANGETEIHT
jgi:hypothetical protein